MRLPPSPPPGRVLGLYHPTAQANAYYRVVAPLSVLPGATWAAYADLTAAQVDAAETVVCSRLGGTREQTADFITDWQARGVRVVLDYDDDYFLPWPEKPKDPALREMVVESVAHAITIADAVIVPNERLRGVFQARTAVPVRVSPNMVRPDWWTAPGERTGRMVIGLFGSPSHEDDWRQVAVPLARLRAMRPGVIIYCLGYLPAYLRNVATHASRWAGLTDYMACVNACDVLLAPLADTPFNHGKSPGRALEAGLAGCACIGNPTVYGDVLRAAELPVVTRPGEWYDALAGYLDDPARLAAHGAALAAHVREQFDVRCHVGTLTTLYDATEELTCR